MERARELYERVITNGEDAIDEFIETRATEELFLDFKRSSDDGNSRHLSPTDRNNLAKAISGFGNSSGGIVIWGVDCSADNDGADVAHTKVPINNIQRFLGNLQGAVSGCTLPTHNGVEHHAISTNGEDRGYAVTYIPASENAPHQVIGRSQYYIRAGSNFVPAPHQVLAGMFGRRPQPHVFHMITVSPARNDGPNLICEYGIVVTNGGPGIARDLFFTTMIHEGLGDNTRISWQFKDKDNWNGNFMFGRQISIISNENIRVPPKAFLVPLTLSIELRPPFTERLLLKGNIGCAGSPTMNIEIENCVAEVSRLYDEYFARLDTGDLPDAFRHQVASGLLNIL
ncbi:MAG: ATP-binding protein [Gallionella sp.]